jgi:hypothetical protein
LELARWETDAFRCPPYQYRDDNGVWLDDKWEPVGLEDREEIMGFPAGHTLPAMYRHEKNDKALEIDTRRSLVGNSFSCQSLALLLGEWCQQHEVRRRPETLAEVYGLPSKTECQLLESRLGDLDLVGIKAELVKHWHGLPSYKGGDLRRPYGLHHPNSVPRLPLDPSWWKWRVCVAYRRSRGHINELEMHAVLAALRWRRRLAHRMRRRVLHLVDSQVVLSALAKGRSPSRRLNYDLKKANALVLASGIVIVYGYIRSRENPADGPSRWV